MRLFFLTIPNPLRQHPIKKKIIHSAAIFYDLGEKLHDPSRYLRCQKSEDAIKQAGQCSIQKELSSVLLNSH
jgi:hypothetical protein